MLEPDLLRTFVSICESGSFTAAARTVGRTQSAVSMQIKRLEETLGRPLLERGPHAARPTTHGRLLLDHARRILAVEAEALAAFELSAGCGGLVVGAPDDWAAGVLPAAVAAFAAEHPELRIELVCEPLAALRRRIDEGRLDFAFAPERMAPEGRPVCREPLYWLGSARVDLHRRDPVPLALLHEGCANRAAALDALAQAGRAWRLAATGLGTGWLQAAVRAGLGVTALGAGALAPGLRLLDEADGLPPLPAIEMRLLRVGRRRAPALDLLEQRLLDAFRASSARRQEPLRLPA